ncbi:MAG: TM0106 family RecB-like putative nuclease [Cyanobacteriota bacterium ELA615]
MILTDGLFLDHRRCQRRAHLNFYEPLEREPERGFLTKLRQESAAQVRFVLENFYPHSRELQSSQQDFLTRTKETLHLMQEGVECIANPNLLFEDSTKGVTFLGTPHLLIKVSGESIWGDWSYIPINIQLGRRPKPEYKLIASYYAYLLAKIQQQPPEYAQIILRKNNYYRVNLVEWLPRLERALSDCLAVLSKPQEPEVFISRQHCNLCHWYSHCYAIAQDQQHLSLVPGITPSRYKSLQSLGLSTLDSLVGASPDLLEPIFGRQVVTLLKLQAQSLQEKRAFIKSKYLHPQLPSSLWEFYFDIEAEPELDLEYLLGVLLVNTKTKELKYYSLLAESPQQEHLIWRQFLEIMEQFPTAPIFHYSEYEPETLKKLAYRYSTPTPLLDSLLKRCVDLHQQVMCTVIMPVESYSLKALANWLGFVWRDPGISGDQCVCWYDDWLKTGERSWLDSIVRYNEDDCIATYQLRNWLLDFLTAPNAN